MERLPVGQGTEYSAVEAAIHVGRYAPVLPLCTGRRILDVACGEGYGSWLMSQAGAISVLGVDISREAIATAASLFAEKNLRFQTSAAESIREATTGRPFDLVVSIETIEHLDDPRKFLRDLRTIAAPDCIFLVTCPNDHWYYHPGEGNPYHKKKYSFYDFQQLTLKELGDNVQWYNGMPAFGFTTVPSSKEDIKAYPSRYVDVCTLQSVLLNKPAPDDRVDDTTCSYFVGIWNLPSKAFGGGAIFPISMDAFAKFYDRPHAVRLAARELISSLEDEQRTLRQSNADLVRKVKERESISAQVKSLQDREQQLMGELAESEQREKSLSSALAESRHTIAAKEDELRAKISTNESNRLLATALRYENQVLREQMQNMTALKRDMRRLAEEVDAHKERYAGLLSRYESLDAEATVLRASVQFWREKKTKLVSHVPAVARPFLRRIYRAIANR